jgi:hypothetical protein
LNFRTPDGSTEVDLLAGESGRVENLRRRAVKATVDQRTFFVASLDDLISMKQRAGRPQDVLDVAELQDTRRWRALLRASPERRPVFGAGVEARRASHWGLMNSSGQQGLTGARQDGPIGTSMRTMSAFSCERSNTIRLPSGVMSNVSSRPRSPRRVS